MQRVIKHASKLGARLFRNNIGETWIGKSQYITKTDFVKVERGDVVIRKARRFHAGLADFSGDAVGFTPVIVTQEMVGQTLAVFTNAEVKKDEKAAKAAYNSKQKRETGQRKFIEFVVKMGGIAGFVGSEDDLDKLLSGYHIADNAKKHKTPNDRPE